MTFDTMAKFTDVTLGIRHRGTGGLGGYRPPLFAKINNNVLKRSREFAND